MCGTDNRRVKFECKCDAVPQKWQYRSALRSTDNSPCTNAPVACPACDACVPMYGLCAHYTCEHDELDATQLLAKIAAGLFTRSNVLCRKQMAGLTTIADELGPEALKKMIKTVIKQRNKVIAKG